MQWKWVPEMGDQMNAEQARAESARPALWAQPSQPCKDGIGSDGPESSSKQGILFLEESDLGTSLRGRRALQPLEWVSWREDALPAPPEVPHLGRNQAQSALPPE